MALTPEGYIQRLIDSKIEKHLKIFGAVSVEGPKWCGKTWTVSNHANSITGLTDRNNRDLAEIDPETALKGEEPHAIDEWQVVPEIWDAVRHEVDKKTTKGRFLLTGSEVPEEEKDSSKKKILHSGTGRISTIRMRTMTLYESGNSSEEISLSAVLDGKPIKPGIIKTSPIELSTMACVGGWPGILGIEAADAIELPNSYIERLVNSKTASGKAKIRNQDNFRFFLSSLARNSASLVSNSTLHNEVQSASGEFSAITLSSYLQILRNQYVLEEVPGWNPRIRSKARILQAPKRFFTDPSLAAAALGATPKIFLNDWQAFGGIFENLCLRDLLVYAELFGARLYHYRDNSNLEVDAILEFPDSSWGAFEIKLSEKGAVSGIKSLLALKNKMEKAGHIPPRCLAVITGSGIAQRRDDGVYVIPITMIRE